MKIRYFLITFLIALIFAGSLAFSADAYTIMDQKEEKVTVSTNFTDTFSGLGIASDQPILNKATAYNTASTAAKVVLMRNYSRSVSAKIINDHGNFKMSEKSRSFLADVNYLKVSDYLCLAKANYRMKINTGKTGLAVYSFSMKANGEYDLGDQQGLKQFYTDVISKVDGVVIQYLRAKYPFRQYIEFNYYNVLMESITNEGIRVVFKYSVKSRV
jgi:hypothetical protein